MPAKIAAKMAIARVLPTPPTVRRGVNRFAVWLNIAFLKQSETSTAARK
ncbi:MAG: hypothetical protein WBA39_15275 [Rivularia sp. (in: cyanobacteria)]